MADLITNQGDMIILLKKNKVDKDVINKEVNKLLDMKDSFREKFNEHYYPTSFHIPNEKEILQNCIKTTESRITNLENNLEKEKENLIKLKTDYRMKFCNDLF